MGMNRNTRQTEMISIHMFFTIHHKNAERPSACEDHWCVCLVHAALCTPSMTLWTSTQGYKESPDPQRSNFLEVTNQAHELPVKYVLASCFEKCTFVTTWKDQVQTEDLSALSEHGGTVRSACGTPRSCCPILGSTFRTSGHPAYLSIPCKQPRSATLQAPGDKCQCSNQLWDNGLGTRPTQGQLRPQGHCLSPLGLL